MLMDFSVSLLFPTELRTLVRRIVQITRELGLDGFFQKLLQLIGQDEKDLESVLVRQRESEFTPLLTNADNDRDEAFIAFRNFVNACSRRKNGDVATAASLLTELIRKHGWTLYGFANPQESAALNLLFKDLDQPKAAEAVQRIGAESWYADLKEAQVAYETLYQNKVSTEAQENYPQLRNAKFKLGRHAQLLTECIGTLYEAEPTPELAKAIDQINQVITDVMTPVRARQTRNAKAGSETSDASPVSAYSNPIIFRLARETLIHPPKPDSMQKKLA